MSQHHNLLISEKCSGSVKFNKTSQRKLIQTCLRNANWPNLPNLLILKVEGAIDGKAWGVMAMTQDLGQLTKSAWLMKTNQGILNSYFKWVEATLSLIGQKQHLKINNKKWIRKLEDINNVMCWFNINDSWSCRHPVIIAEPCHSLSHTGP